MDLIFLQEYKDKRVCVALSGGVDSVALLHVFFTRGAEYGIALSAVTCEHGIRGEASLSDLEFVKNLCRNWGVPLSVFREDVPARAKEHRRGLEEEGRAFRYACFKKLLAEGKCDLVATAHHADDYAETVLFRLARGTSLGGLNAIRSQDGIARPFLSVSRARIEEYAREHALEFVLDETNADERYARNKIRKTVMPALEEISRGAGRHIAAFARRAAEDDAYLRSLAEARLTLKGEEARFPADLPASLFTRACAAAFLALGIDRDYTEENFADVASLNALQAGRRIVLPKGAEAAREGAEIVIYRPEKAEEREFAFPVDETAFGCYIVRVGKVPQTGALVCDLDAFPQGCILRTRRQGDVFTPYKGREKPLKEYLTDKKIPARIGRGLPLIAKGNEIFAVFGVEISDKVKVTEQTRRRGYLSAERRE